MDNLVLIRVAAALAASLDRAVVREVRDEPPHRMRLLFEAPEGLRSVLISLRPELPWIGRPALRRKQPHRTPGRFVATLRRELAGAVVEGVTKDRPDRIVRLTFSGGATLVVELATHGANLILLDPGGRVVASARRPPSAADRIRPGGEYRAPALPRRLLDPFGAAPARIDRFLAEQTAAGEETFEALRRRVFGVGSRGAELVLRESRSSGRSVGTVLVERIAALEAGRDDPVFESPDDPLGSTESDRLDPAALRLWPWKPPTAENTGRRGEDAAATAGLFHEAVERAVVTGERTAALRALLERELRRVRQAQAAARGDRARFEDPERYRRWGEALLAGLSRATRIGDAWQVPDPYDAEGAPVVVPARPGLPVQKVAEGLFDKHRKALRGQAEARRRTEALAGHRRRLERLAERVDAGRATLDEIEAGMRQEGIPVALEATRATREAARVARPRLEGVRLLTSGDGLTILVGRGSRENHRLTFRLAGPEDFWFHALGCPGAHVVVRADRKQPRPPRRTLEEAAAVAAWFSDAKNQPWAEVQWTRRKYVRKPRGAAPGTVVLKRFETVRVRPGLPRPVE